MTRHAEQELMKRESLRRRGLLDAPRKRKHHGCTMHHRGRQSSQAWRELHMLVRRKATLNAQR